MPARSYDSIAVGQGRLGTFRTCGHVGYQVLSGHRRDMRDLGAVLEHEKSLPIRLAIKRSSVQDHQRSIVRRRRDEPRTIALAKFEGITRPR